MIADFFTKALPTPRFEYLRAKIMHQVDVSFKPNNKPNH